MVVESVSAHRPAGVQVERRGLVSDVWIRRDIAEEEVAMPEGGGARTQWRCREVHLTLPGTPTVAEVTAMADELWAKDATEPSLSDLQAQVEEQARAIEEIIPLVLGGDE